MTEWRLFDSAPCGPAGIVNDLPGLRMWTPDVSRHAVAGRIGTAISNLCSSPKPVAL